MLLMSNRVFKNYEYNQSELPIGVVRRNVPLIVNKYNKPNITTVADFIPKNHQIIRSGVIVYSYNNYNNEYYFYMGQDQNSNDLTDFGGGCLKEHDPIESALREFTEESKAVFGNYTKDQVNECIMAYTDSMLIIFIPLIVDYTQLKYNFNLSVPDNQHHNELNDIIRLNKQEFIQAIYSDKYKLYIIVKQFLQGMLLNNVDFFQKL